MVGDPSFAEPRVGTDQDSLAVPLVVYCEPFLPRNREEFRDFSLTRATKAITSQIYRDGNAIHDRFEG